MADERKEINAKDCVLVTGASGYIALHCVQQLLEAGYEVRGTVRSLCDSEKVGPLRDLKYSSDRLELVEADLECAEHWPDAIQGCTYILHVASPWPIVADESTVTTARDGTLNVLKGAASTGTVKKVVVTSSCAAINDGHKNKSRVFDETCWADLNSKRIEHYGKSKAVAERAAWDFWESLPKHSRFELTVLNPTLVTGPVLSQRDHGSAMIIRRMMDYRTFLAIPKVSLGVVDVRDVARAHVKALKAPETNGERILITAVPSVWFAQMAEWLHKEFKKQGYMVSRLQVPNWLVKLYAKTNVDPHVAALKHRFGSELRFDNTKSKRLLGMQYIPPQKSIIDMVYSMIDFGMIKPKAKPRSKSVDVARETTIEKNAESRKTTIGCCSDTGAIVDQLSNNKTPLAEISEFEWMDLNRDTVGEKIAAGNLDNCAHHENNVEQTGDHHLDGTNQAKIEEGSGSNQATANTSKDTEEIVTSQQEMAPVEPSENKEAMANPGDKMLQATIEQNGAIPIADKA